MQAIEKLKDDGLYDPNVCRQIKAGILSTFRLRMWDKQSGT